MRNFPLPDNKRFGEYLIQFFQGNKNPDDYIIKINGVQVTDNDIFNELHKYSKNENMAVRLLKFIWELGQRDSIQEERDVYNRIQELKTDDELKAILFAIWHRLIIDDVNYPIERGLNGRRRLLGQIYLLFAKKFGFKLPDYILTLPEEIFRLGFPNKIIEKVSTDQWNEIYELYKEFYERRQDA